MKIEDGFQPVPWIEGNVYLEDPVLPSLLRRLLPNDAYKEIHPDLERLGSEVVTVIRPLASSAAVSAPTITQYDQWGRRVDHLQTSEGWRKLKAIAQKERLPGAFYERAYKEHSRVYGFAKVLLMVGDTQEVFCPLSMTDGTARIIELIGNAQLKKEVLPRLTSDPATAFTAGQWMTERPGGSDVSLTETTATSLVSQDHPYGPKYVLNGIKWFSSATDSEISVALARTGPLSSGSRALSLFLIPLRLPLFPDPNVGRPSPVSNNIFVHRLKNKIGTHALPTAELTLQDTEAYLIGPLNQGVKNITPMLNITRLWSAVTSAGHLRKCLSIATAYSRVRAIQSGAQLLQDAPLHVARLAQINLLYRALTHLSFGAISLMGKVECGVATHEEVKRLRLLTPVVKAFCAEKACAGMEEAMTALGGVGYMEENGIGRAIRDGLVEKIWEGTVVVLALDLVRSARDPATLKIFISWAEYVIRSIPTNIRAQFQGAIQVLSDSLVAIQRAYSPPLHPLAARPALIVVGYISSSIYLLEHAVWALTNNETTREVDTEVFKRWVMEAGFRDAVVELSRAMDSDESRINSDRDIVFGANVKTNL